MTNKEDPMGLKKFFKETFCGKPKKKPFSLEDIFPIEPKDRAAISFLGSPDPVFKRIREEVKESIEMGRRVIGACDVKVYFDDESVGSLQGISFGYRSGNHDVPSTAGGIGGTCDFVAFYSMDHIKWLGKEVHLSLVAASEYGEITTVYNAKVKFDEHEQFGVSVDDIITEIRLDFTLVERYFTDYVRPEPKL